MTKKIRVTSKVVTSSLCKRKPKKCDKDQILLQNSLYTLCQHEQIAFLAVLTKAGMYFHFAKKHCKFFFL